MKLLGKTKDGAIDSLLRAYVARPRNRVCSEFDADLANAYIERSLTTASRSRYEQHLSECAPCRKNVIALSRLTESESRPSISARADTRLGGRQIFGVTSWPRWAMAAAAVIVLAISLPLLLTRKENRVAQEASRAAAESPAPENTQAINRSREMSPAPAAKQPAASASASAESKRSEKAQIDTVSSNAPAPAQQPAGSAGDRAGSGGKLEAKKEAQPTDQGQVKTDEQRVSEVAAGQEQQEKRSDKDDALGARQQQPSKDAADTKSRGNEQDQQNAKEKTRLAESAAPAPPPAAPGVKVGRLKRPSAKLGLRDSSPAESVRPTEKRVGSKKFSLKNDTWTDKDFDPDKDLPVVTIIRDSNVYNELLSKQAGLKPYLGGFAETERAIIVYKGTVYKLIPQQSSK